jgi:hypothetical protein
LRGGNGSGEVMRGKPGAIFAIHGTDVLVFEFFLKVELYRGLLFTF